MDKGQSYSDYDDFAWFYNRFWGAITSSPQVQQIMDQLILSSLPAGGRILDVCCGTGQLDKVLTQRGYKVTALDSSLKQLEYARRNAPASEIIHADARAFELPQIYDGAISIFDSLNHIMTLQDMEKVFVNIYEALRPGGLFLFDMNTKDGLRKRWKGSESRVEEDSAFIAVFSYEPLDNTARVDFTLFRKIDGNWQRKDLALLQKAYDDEELASALSRCGFFDIEVRDASEDRYAAMGMDRAFFMARKAGST